MNIALNHVRKTYSDAGRELVVISDLSRQFPARVATAIVGRSGTGKSTLLHLLGGLDSPSSGSVLFDEVDLATLAGDKISAFRGKHVGFIFQFHHLLPEFTALENVIMPLSLIGVDDVQAEERARLLLTEVGLEQRLEHLPAQLSGGEQQRISVARALACSPSVVLADEPTGNLDPTTAREVQELLLRVTRDSGTTLIVATHNHDLARSMDTGLEMKPGGELHETRI